MSDTREGEQIIQEKEKWGSLFLNNKEKITNKNM